MEEAKKIKLSSASNMKFKNIVSYEDLTKKTNNNFLNLREEFEQKTTESVTKLIEQKEAILISKLDKLGINIHNPKELKKLKRVISSGLIESTETFYFDKTRIVTFLTTVSSNLGREEGLTSTVLEITYY